MVTSNQAGAGGVAPSAAGGAGYVGSGRGGYGNIVTVDSMTPEQRAQVSWWAGFEGLLLSPDPRGRALKA